MTGNTMKTSDSAATLRREAAEWFERIHADDASTDDLSEWQRWLVTSPAHLQAFGKVEDLWRRGGELAKPPWASQAELDADTYDASVPLHAWQQQQQQQQEQPPPPQERASRPRRYLWSIAASLSVLAVSSVAYVLVFRGPSPSTDLAVFDTRMGEHRDFTLPDGTRVELGARSTVSVSFDDRARNVTVDSGEAFFTVAPDRSWPFVVRVGDKTVSAVGTAFNVENLSGRIEVTVAEGVVEVVNIRAPAPEMPRVEREPPRAEPVLEPLRLTAGQRIVYGRATAEVQKVDPERALTWRQGRLTFMDEPLKYVIADVARYTSRQLVITDPAVEEIRYSGTVLRDGVDEWLESLDDAFPSVEVERIDDNRVILQSRRVAETREQK